MRLRRFLISEPMAARNASRARCGAHRATDASATASRVASTATVGGGVTAARGPLESQVEVRNLAPELRRPPGQAADREPADRGGACPATDRSRAVVLAAGEGTRMRSATPKVLHPLCGRPMLLHVLDALVQLPLERIVVVVGHGAEHVTKTLQEQLVDRHPGRVRRADACNGAPATPIERGAHRLRRRPRRRGRPASSSPATSRCCAPRRSPRSPPSTAIADAAATLLTAARRRPHRATAASCATTRAAVDRIVEQADATADELDDRRGEPVDLLLPARPARARAAAAQPRERAGRVLPHRRRRRCCARPATPCSAVEADDPTEAFGVNDRAQLAARRGRAARAHQRPLDARRASRMVDPAAHLHRRRPSSSRPTCRCSRARSSRGAPSIGAGSVIGPDTQLVDTVVGDDAVDPPDGRPRVRDRRRRHRRPVRVAAAGHAPRRRRARRHVRRDQERRDRRGRQGAAPLLHGRRRDRPRRQHRRRHDHRQLRRHAASTARRSAPTRAPGRTRCSSRRSRSATAPTPAPARW